MGSEKYILLDLAKYLSFQKCKRTLNLLISSSDFSKKGVCSKSAAKMLYRNKFL